MRLGLSVVELVTVHLQTHVGAWKRKKPSSGSTCWALGQSGHVTYRPAAAGRGPSGRLHPESRTETPRLSLETKKRIVRAQILTEDQRDQSASACVSNPGSDLVVRTEEAAAVPALELCSGGCWVILSFTQEPVRVSKSGGTVSISERGGGVREQQRSHKGSSAQ